MPKGAILALAAATLFAASTPLAKLLLAEFDPLALASVLYLGAGAGLGLVFVVRPLGGNTRREAYLRRPDLPWLLGIIVSGGLIGPILLLIGLAHTTASASSLLLNLEGLATMTIAWVVFRESLDRRLLVGAAAIVMGAIVLAWRADAAFGWGAVAIAAACVAWGIDNNLTRRLSHADPVQLVMIKGLAAGAVNGVLALVAGSALPDPLTLARALLVGFVGYGLSLVLFVLALRQIGTARTGAYFSTAPFLGAALSVAVLGDAVTPQLLVAGALMASGVYLHLRERHQHMHDHEAILHEHRHVHDEHHRHDHESGDPAAEPHVHMHRHAPLTHGHAHFPDLHHQHQHGRERRRLGRGRPARYSAGK